MENKPFLIFYKYQNEHFLALNKKLLLFSETLISSHFESLHEKQKTVY